MFRFSVHVRVDEKNWMFFFQIKDDCQNYIKLYQNNKYSQVFCGRHCRISKTWFVLIVPSEKLLTIWIHVLQKSYGLNFRHWNLPQILYNKPGNMKLLVFWFVISTRFSWFWSAPVKGNESAAVVSKDVLSLMCKSERPAWILSWPPDTCADFRAHTSPVYASAIFQSVIANFPIQFFCTTNTLNFHVVANPG